MGGSVLVVFFLFIYFQGNNILEVCFENFLEVIWKIYFLRIVIFIEIVGFFIFLILNVICFSMVLRILNKFVILSRSKINKIKVLKMIFVYLVIFCFCFVFYNINFILYFFMRIQIFVNCLVVIVVRIMYLIIFCIVVLNCCFDFIVYYFMLDIIQNLIKMKNWFVRRIDFRFFEV